MSITSDEVNYLVYRYLVESGFTHSSFAFQYESLVHLQDKVTVSNGQLINILQKGLLFSQVESHINPDGTEKKCIAPFTLLGPHECQAPKEKKRKVRKELPKSQAFDAANVSVQAGHQKEIFTCAWNPKYDLVATGAGDGTARIWNIPDSASKPVESIILPHTSGEETRDVTTLEWSPDGEYLATGSYDGIARVWLKNGTIRFKMKRHNGPVFSLKWNSSGTLLLSGGVDKTAVIWDTSSGESRQQYSFHAAPVLDVDWKDENTFASGSADSRIYVCQLGSLAPLKHFYGHKNEVNAVKWDPSGKYLASCSDDQSVKIWTMDKDHPVLDLTGYGKAIYSIKWMPQKEPDLILATASFDGSVRLWNINTGQCVQSLSQHSEAVYSVSFSPDCQYLASGSFDKTALVWDAKDGNLLRSYTGGGGIFELCYSPKGDKIAAAYSDNKLVILYVGNENLNQ